MFQHSLSLKVIKMKVVLVGWRPIHLNVAICGVFGDLAQHQSSRLCYISKLLQLIPNPMFVPRNNRGRRRNQSGEGVDMSVRKYSI